MQTSKHRPQAVAAKWRQHSNPFSTRFVMPAARRFLFGDAHVSLSLISQDFLLNRRARIVVGPHGTGKTTLLNRLANALSHHYDCVSWLRLREGEANSGVLRSIISCDKRTLLVVDGVEQLNLMRQKVLSRVDCLVTSHVDVPGFHLLYRTSPTLELARNLTAHLLTDEPHKIGPALEEVEKFWVQVDGNIRELWFLMYDWYSENQSQS